ncbi:MAG: DsbA family protein [Tabrizicola sp.]|nr:DsbA family protein [Tabrizicola sp.]MDP3262692.1 DsbA family protein [Tabrizicola sp.]MDP3647371.1 DsbA family protein [Paracoccaceae bacterium]MDZ4066778.1 DsbA family protein [Tabrizicola sp.]
MAMSPVLARTALAQDAPEPTDFSLGDPNAPVKMVEYASFTCPHCADFHENVFKNLKRDYIDTGKVHFTLREVYFDRYGLWAAMVARCGGEMRYFGIHDVLFSTQKEWAGSDDPTVVVANLKTIALAAGMDGAAVDACLKDGPMAEALIKRFETNMAADGVEGTPTIFINGAKHSNMSYDDLKALLDAELAK